MKFNYISKRKLATFALSTALLGTTALNMTACSKDTEIDPETKAIIEQIISENDTGKEILSYLEISEQLNQINLSEYSFSKDLNVTLDTTYNINEKISMYWSDKEKGIINVSTIDYLKKQEALVNSYIYSFGRDYVNKELFNSATTCANLLFELNNTSGEVSYVKIYDKEFDNEDGIVTVLVSVNNEQMQEVIEVKEKLYGDYNESTYDYERNNAINNALIKSTELDNFVKNSIDIVNPKIKCK